MTTWGWKATPRGETTSPWRIKKIEYGQRALRNDLENIPMFVAISYAYVALGAWELGAKIYFPLFILARIGHTFCYLPPKQPGRTVCYGIGLLTTLVVCGHVVFKAISSLM